MPGRRQIPGCQNPGAGAVRLRVVILESRPGRGVRLARPRLTDQMQISEKWRHVRGPG